MLYKIYIDKQDLDFSGTNYIGSNNSAKTFKGAIDDFRFYNVVLNKDYI